MQSCRLLKLLNLSRLADLHILDWSLQANDVDLDLPPSLTQLNFGGYPKVVGGHKCVDIFRELLIAVKCVRRGAQLHRLICKCAVAFLQPAQWGANLEEQHKRLGGQLGSLKELVVMGAQEQVLSAVGAIASAAPSLTRLCVIITHELPRVEILPICSASLESIRVEREFYHRPGRPPPQVLLTLLPGCTRLQEVVVRFRGEPFEGNAVRIRCH